MARTSQPVSGTPSSRRRPDQALVLTDAGAVVDPALVLDHQLQPAAPARQRDRPLVVLPLEDADGSAVEEHRGPVTDLAEREDARAVAGSSGSSVR